MPAAAGCLTPPTTRCDEPGAGRAPDRRALPATELVVLSGHGCTIVGRNYFAQARVLARSFLEHHPGGQFTVLVLDKCPPPLAGDDFEIVRPLDLFDSREFGRMATMYAVTELATAVKPTFLRSLLQRGSDAVLYLDPDIEIFAPLDDVISAASEHRIVLTPHMTEPQPRWDGLAASEDIVLSAGVHNLGFIGVGADAGEFLDWWVECLARECIIDPSVGRFVDQRWVDLAPGYFGARLLRDPGLNVAWWNLPTRKFERSDAGFVVNGHPLRFMHFSGYEPRLPHLFSKHQGPFPRVLLSERPELQTLCENYKQQLFDAGYPLLSRMEFGYNRFPSGLQVSPRMRALYRDALLEAERGTVRIGATRPPEPPCPFDGEEEAFLEWLRTPVDRGFGTYPVGRYLESVWCSNPDAMQRFPDLHWGDTAEFLRWAQANRDAEEIPPQVLAEGDDSARRPVAPPPQPGSGVNVVGYFRAELGVGEAARQVLSGITTANIPHSTVLYDLAPSRQRHAFSESGLAAAVHDTNIICVNADQYLTFLHQAGPAFREGRRNVAVWWWEVEDFPDAFGDPYGLVDEIWTGSEFVAGAIRGRTDTPVFVMPLPVHVETATPVARGVLGLPEGFLFLFSFDFYSVFERKNPLAIIEAFRRAFAPNEGPHLVIKSINGDKHLVALEELRWAAADRSDITVWDGYLDAEKKDALMASADCYVSLHRSEGFGLTMAESMAAGRPVIATGYSGNLAFMNAENSYLVPFSMGAVPPDCPPYPEGTKWAEPDINEAARLMRQVFSNPEDAASRGARGKAEILASHSPEAMAAFVQERLSAIKEGAPRPSSENGRAESATSASDGSQSASSSLPVWAGPSRFGPPGRLAKRFLFRLLRPYGAVLQTAHEGILAESEHRSREILQTEGPAIAARAADYAVRDVRALRGSLDETSLAGQAASLALSDAVNRQRDISARVEALAAEVVGLRGANEAARTSTYAAINTLARRYAQHGRAAAQGTPLTPFELRVFSQNGEDGIIEEILGRIGTSTRWFIEFGVESGIEANCVFLGEVLEWSGLFIEADPDHAQRLSQRWSHRPSVATICEAVTPANVESLFRRAGAPAEPDVLSIDVDGNDYWIWKAISEFRPRVLVIEYNSFLDAAGRQVQPYDPASNWDGTDYYGASLGALRALGDEKGYRLVHTDIAGVNAFFVREDLAGSFVDPDAVPVRGPNYFLAGEGHPPDLGNRRYIDPLA